MLQYFYENFLHENLLGAGEMSRKAFWGGQPAEVSASMILQSSDERLFDQGVVGASVCLFASVEVTIDTQVVDVFELLDYEVTVGNLSTVDLNEGNLPFR